MKMLTAYYPSRYWPAWDDLIMQAVGREADGTGMGGSARDLVWWDLTDEEVSRMAEAAKSVSYRVTIFVDEC